MIVCIHIKKHTLNIRGSKKLTEKMTHIRSTSTLYTHNIIINSMFTVLKTEEFM